MKSQKTQDLLSHLKEIQRNFEQLSKHPDYPDLLESTQICCDISLGDSLQRVESAVTLLENAGQMLNLITFTKISCFLVDKGESNDF